MFEIDSMRFNVKRMDVEDLDEWYLNYIDAKARFDEEAAKLGSRNYGKLWIIEYSESEEPYHFPAVLGEFECSPTGKKIFEVKDKDALIALMTAKKGEIRGLEAKDSMRFKVHVRDLEGDVRTTYEYDNYEDAHVRFCSEMAKLPGNYGRVWLGEYSGNLIATVTYTPWGSKTSTK